MYKNVKSFEKFNENLNSPTENKKEIDGNEYYLNYEKKFWMSRQKNVIPGVICTCGNTEFELSYGEYEIIAHCTNCGNNDSVYSG